MRPKPSLSKSAAAQVIVHSNDNSGPSRLTAAQASSKQEGANSYNYRQQQSTDICATSYSPNDKETILDNDNQLHSISSALSSSVSTSSFFSYDNMICRCCGRQECNNTDYYVDKIRKLESDTRLAAEIGQGLLHKHETFVNESNQQKAQLQQQLNECHERIIDLEQSLEEMELSKEEVAKEKNKWLWEYQKLQKILDETIADLEMANDKCSQLTDDVQAKNAELEKLRVYKFMARHSETREEALAAKLEDTNQELAIRKKNELILEAKVKKLKSRYETLQAHHEKLTRQTEQRVVTTQTSLGGDNSTSNSEKSLLTSHLGNSREDNKHANDFIHLIKELSAINSKLKNDLMNCKEQLSEAQEEIVALTLDKRVQEDLIFSPSSSTSSSETHHLQLSGSNKSNQRSSKIEGETLNDLLNCNNSNNNQARHCTPVGDTNMTHREHSDNETLDRPQNHFEPAPTNSTTPSCTPSISLSPLNTATALEGQNAIVHHHHYHYYVNNKDNEEVTTEIAVQQQQEANHRETHSMMPATAISSESTEMTIVRTPSLTKSPYSMLQEHVTQILNRIGGSDIRALNRRLKRTFDISELSSMSNSIIENILVDIDALESRFLWLKPTVIADLSLGSTVPTTAGDQHMKSFFSFLYIIKDLLRELGVLKMTMNDLQVVYVKKVEEDEMRVQEEVIKKRQLRRRETVNMPSLSKSASTLTDSSTSTAKTARPLSWFTNMFSKSSLVQDDDMSCSCSIRSSLTRGSQSIHSPSLLPQELPIVSTAFAQQQKLPPSNEHVPPLQPTTTNYQEPQNIIRTTSDTTPITTNRNNVRFIPNKPSSSRPSMSTTIDSIYHTSFSRSTFNQQQHLIDNTNKRRSLSSFFTANAVAPSRSSSLSASVSQKTKRKDIPSTFETDYRSFEAPIPPEDQSAWKMMHFTSNWLNNNNN